MRTYIQTYIQLYIHTCPHTYVHTNAHSAAFISMLAVGFSAMLRHCCRLAHQSCQARSLKQQQCAPEHMYYKICISMNACVLVCVCVCAFMRFYRRLPMQLVTWRQEIYIAAAKTKKSNNNNKQHLHVRQQRSVFECPVLTVRS